MGGLMDLFEVRDKNEAKVPTFSLTTNSKSAAVYRSQLAVNKSTGPARKWGPAAIRGWTV